MKSKIVAISIDKVQTFLYYAINAHVQEKQTNSDTLSSIIGSSSEISDCFYDKLGVGREDGYFSGYIKEQDILLKCSGTCIFATEMREEDIRERCKALFQYYYQKFQGQMQIRYVTFPMSLETESDKLEAIQKAKENLKGKQCLNQVIEDNQELLFQLHPVESSFENKQQHNSQEFSFEKNINKLFPEGESEESTFRIAVIKADLDGMGTLFSSTKEFDVYQKISAVLNRNICLDALREKVRVKKERDATFKMYPLYIAGDDILFAVPINHILTGVNICRELLKDINREITKNVEVMKPLSMSIGIESTFNREPIRYYYERVQLQMEEAKKEKAPKQLQGISYMKICMNYCVLFQFDKNDLGKEKTSVLNENTEFQQWSHFVSNVKNLYGLQERGFKTHYYLYGLLQILENEEMKKSEIKRSNAILYHLLPQHMKSSDKILGQMELILIKKLLEQVTVKREKSHYLCFEEKQCKKLESYIRLLLLFSEKERFCVIENKKEKVKEFDEKRFRAAIFNRSLRYLYECNLYQSLLNGTTAMEKDVKKLRNVFVKGEMYKTEQRKDVQVYLTSPVSSSMFYRMKQKVDYEIAANMIESIDGRDKEEYERAKKECEKKYKAPPKLYFSPEKREEFLKIAGSSGIWTKDYIDSLLVFYQLNDSLIHFRTIYPTKKTKGRRKK